MSWFDRFASAASTWVSRAPFFAFCVLLIVVWLPSYFVFGDMNTWQLIINTVTTVVTFLLVALLQNSQERFEKSTNAKLDRVLEAVGQADAVGLEEDVSA